jgi:hypothetical protein
LGHPVADDETGRSFFRAGKKHRNVARRMLTVSVHAQSPLKTRSPGMPPARSQGGPLAAIARLPDHFCTRPTGLFRRGIRRTIIHHDDTVQVALNARHDRTNPTGFIEARYYCGALPFPIHHSLVMARSGAF